MDQAPPPTLVEPNSGAPTLKPGRVAAGGVFVALILGAFHVWGPAPEAAADAALARALAKEIGAHPATWRLLDPSHRCPKTAAVARASGDSAAAAKRVRREPVRCSLKGDRLRLVPWHKAAALAATKAVGRPLPSVRVPRPSSLLGPLAAVALVLTLQRAALGLFLAVLFGAVAAFGPVAGARVAAVDVFWPTLTNGDNLLILAFTATMLGMVHVAIAGGGFRDLAWRIARSAADHPEHARRRTRMAAWLLGLAIFFDDYANSLVVGSSIRPLADRTGVSRAKLAYLVDATSAAGAGVAIVSTWVGFEVGLLDDQIARFGDLADAGYGVFLAALPYRFYCILTVVFAGLIAWTGRDFGPMRRAEARAQAGAQPPERPAGRAHWLDAMGPVLGVLLTVIGLDLWLGRDAAGGLLARFIAGADAAGLKVLAAAGVVGSLAAIGGAVARRLLPAATALRAWISGVGGMLPILAILVCAMAMRAVCEQAGTTDYLAALLGDVAGAWVPVLSFFVAAVVAFMTGSSWATMGILLPMVIPLAAVAPGAGGVWLLAATAAVLDGAIFGDHCSPISDTTVMSSAASGCPHHEHVWTQLPYAGAVMVAAAGFGYVGTAWFDLSAPIATLLAAGFLATVVRVVGRRPAPRPG